MTQPNDNNNPDRKINSEDFIRHSASCVQQHVVPEALTMYHPSADRLAKKLVAPDPAFAPTRIATNSKDEVRFWADGIYDVYVPPLSDTIHDAAGPAAPARLQTASS